MRRIKTYDKYNEGLLGDLKRKVGGMLTGDADKIEKLERKLSDLRYSFSMEDIQNIRRIDDRKHPGAKKRCLGILAKRVFTIGDIRRVLDYLGEPAPTGGRLAVPNIKKDFLSPTALGSKVPNIDERTMDQFTEPAGDDLGTWFVRALLTLCATSEDARRVKGQDVYKLPMTESDKAVFEDMRMSDSIEMAISMGVKPRQRFIDDATARCTNKAWASILVYGALHSLEIDDEVWDKAYDLREYWDPKFPTGRDGFFRLLKLSMIKHGRYPDRFLLNLKRQPLMDKQFDAEFRLSKRMINLLPEGMANEEMKVEMLRLGLDAESTRRAIEHVRDNMRNGGGNLTRLLSELRKAFPDEYEAVFGKDDMAADMGDMGF